MAEETRSTGRMALWVRIVLFASLALNLLVVGIVAGAIFGGKHDRGRWSMGRDAAIPYARALSDADRRALRAALREGFRDRSPAQGSFAAPYRAAVEVLRAEPFERAALEAVLAGQDARAQARQQAGRKALIDRLAAMPPAERSAYADRLSEQIDRLERRWGGKGWGRKDRGTKGDAEAASDTEE